MTFYTVCSSRASPAGGLEKERQSNHGHVDPRLRSKAAAAHRSIPRDPGSIRAASRQKLKARPAATTGRENNGPPTHLSSRQPHLSSASGAARKDARPISSPRGTVTPTPTPTPSPSFRSQVNGTFSFRNESRAGRGGGGGTRPIVCCPHPLGNSPTNRDPCRVERCVKR